MSRAQPLHLVVLIAVCWLLDGIAGALVGLTLATALGLGARPRSLVLAGFVTMCLAALHTIALGLPDESSISSGFVLQRLVAHHLAFGAAALLTVGVLAEELGAASPVRNERRTERNEPAGQ